MVLNGCWSWSAALVLVACIGACSGKPLVGEDGFVRSVKEDHGTYYRLKVKLAYKGESQDFDIVVGCNVRVISYKGGSGNTYEAGLVPTVFGRRMSDGEGLVVRPPNACQGETTANGRVQPDLLPIVVVYDDADALDFGIAYLSEDAYESPVSVLKFGGATIEKATRAEFDEFRRTQPNLVTRESYHSTESDADLKRLGFARLTHPFGNRCQTYMRFRIPTQLRALVDKEWPQSKPKYWRADTYEAESEITKQIWGRAQILTDRSGDSPRPWAMYMEIDPERTADTGLATRAGGGLISHDRENLFPPSLYPATDDYQAQRWPADRSEWPSFVARKAIFVASDIDFRSGRMRGFGYCGANPRTSADEAVNAAVAHKPKIFRVDGHDVVSKRPATGGEIWIFESDEYVFRIFDIFLESTRGDV